MASDRQDPRRTVEIQAIFANPMRNYNTDTLVHPTGTRLSGPTYLTISTSHKTNKTYQAKREYEPFLTPSPCKIATTASVPAVGLSPLL
jgi:hypothetical protein